MTDVATSSRSTSSTLGLLEARTAATTSLIVVGLYLVLALEATSTPRARLVGVLLCGGLLAALRCRSSRCPGCGVLRARGAESPARCCSPSAVGSALAIGFLWLTDDRFVPAAARPADAVPATMSDMAVTAQPRLDTDRAPGRLPVPRGAGQRQAARLSRLGRLDPEAAPGARRDARLLRARYANVHRGVYRLAERATEGYEGARRTVAAFVNAPSEREVIFTRSSTEALNLVAYAWGLDNLGPGDVVVVTELEHHANFVPWQFIASATGASFRHIPIDDARRAPARRARRARPRGHDQGRRDRPRLELARHDQPGRAARGLGARAGRDHGRRRGPGGAAPADRRAGARLRLPRLLVAQAVRAERRRARSGAGASCSRRWRRSTSAAR